MSNLPGQIQRQADEMSAFDQAVEDARKPQTLTPEAPQTPETPGPTGEPKVVTPPPTPPSTPEEVQWRQRYLTLEGKYKAEVPRLHSELRDLKSQLQTALEAMKPQKSVTPAPPKEAKVTPKDVETFGSDLVDLVKRQAEDIVSSREEATRAELEKLRAENERLQASISGVTKSQEASAQEIYLGKLAALVPDWATINTDPGFLEWLSGTDEMSGLTRQAYIDHAYQNQDVQRTAVIFNAWKALAAGKAPEAPAQAKTEIQRQVEPGKSKSVPVTQSDAATKVWTAKEVEQFYRDLREGRFKNTAEAEKIEAEIDLAVSQGRFK
jgi:hypothetical protein